MLEFGAVFRAENRFSGSVPILPLSDHVSSAQASEFCHFQDEANDNLLHGVAVRIKER